jgi:hypothetical protein
MDDTDGGNTLVEVAESSEHSQTQPRPCDSSAPVVLFSMGSLYSARLVIILSVSKDRTHASTDIRHADDTQRVYSLQPCLHFDTTQRDCHLHHSLDAK